MSKLSPESVDYSREYESDRQTEYSFRFAAEQSVGGNNRLPSEDQLERMASFAAGRYSWDIALERLIDYTGEAWARERLYLLSWTQTQSSTIISQEIPQDKTPQFRALSKAYQDMIRGQFEQRGTLRYGPGEYLPYRRPQAPFIAGSM